FVDGTISKPTEKKKMLDCETVNSMLVFWILKAIEPKLAASIPYFEEAKKLWVYLEKRFCEANGPRLQQLHVVITGYVLSQRLVWINCGSSALIANILVMTTLVVLYSMATPHGGWKNMVKREGAAFSGQAASVPGSRPPAIAAASASSSIAAAVDHSKPTVRAHAVGSPLGVASSVPSPDTLRLCLSSNLSMFVFLNMVNNRQQDKMTETGDIFVSRDVKFHENEFPFVTSSDSTHSHVSVKGVSNVDGEIDFDFLDDLEHVLEVGETSTELGSRESSDRTLLDTPSPSPTATPTSAATPLLDAASSLVRDTLTATNADRRSLVVSTTAATTSGTGSIHSPGSNKQARTSNGAIFTR
uniref:Uncharacterized protein n=1 Tax=Chenopodium quinoa TaxID=63459 RepID=A0A803L7K6_CHEQI